MLRDIPPGFVDLGELAVPRDLVDKYTSDADRFRRWVSVALEMVALEPGSLEAYAFRLNRCATPGDADELAATIRELTNIDPERLVAEEVAEHRAPRGLQ